MYQRENKQTFKILKLSKISIRHDLNFLVNSNTSKYKTNINHRGLLHKASRRNQGRLFCRYPRVLLS
jgi:hypothetical protein